MVYTQGPLITTVYPHPIHAMWNWVYTPVKDLTQPLAIKAAPSCKPGVQVTMSYMQPCVRHVYALTFTKKLSGTVHKTNRIVN